jgi:hypothetical protein
MLRRGLAVPYLAVALLPGGAFAGCAAERRADPSLVAHLWKRAQPPIELASGDHLAAGDQLYLTVVSGRTFFVYVINEDAGGKRQILYPCSGSSRNQPLSARQLYRLPLPLLGHETFWPVQQLTSHERMLVLATARPAEALEGAVLGGDGAPPCAAPLDRDANRWLDGLIAANLAARGAAPNGSLGFRKAAKVGEDRWMLAFDLAGLGDHG